MGAELGIEVFTTRIAAQIARVSTIVLEEWIRSGFVPPSILGARGKGSRRVFSFRDVVAIRVAVQLRAHGVEIPAIRLIVAYLQTHERISATKPLAPTLLGTDGTNVFELDESAPLASLRRPGKPPCTVVPLDEIVIEVQDEARRLRREEPPTSHQSENRHVKRAAARVRRAA